MDKQTSFVPVKYIGKEEMFKDRLYKTGIVFKKGETVSVPEAAALKMLRHPDVYARGNEKEADKERTPEEKEALKENMQQQQQEEKRKQEESQNLNDLLQSVESMTKDALIQFADERYNMKLDTRKKKADLVEEVRTEIERYGPR